METTTREIPAPVFVDLPPSRERPNAVETVNLAFVTRIFASSTGGTVWLRDGQRMTLDANQMSALREARKRAGL